MLLLSAPNIAGLIPARCASSIPVSDSRRRRGTHPSIAAVQRAAKCARLDSYPAENVTDWPAPAYVSRNHLPLSVVSHPAEWPCEPWSCATTKHGVYSERNIRHELPTVRQQAGAVLVKAAERKDEKMVIKITEENARGVVAGAVHMSLATVRDADDYERTMAAYERRLAARGTPDEAEAQREWNKISAEACRASRVTA